jgi:uncharacterized RDD family membrane protein YckC
MKRIDETDWPLTPELTIDSKPPSGWQRWLANHRCPACGAPRHRAARFCASCGAAASPVAARVRPLIPARARAGLLRRALAEVMDRFIPLPFIAYFFPAWIWVVVVYHLICDGTPAGRSLGKALCWLRVVSVTSLEPCGLLRSMVRRLGPALCQAAYCAWEFVPLALAYDLISLAFVWLNPSGRRLEDYLAGTQVITEGAYRQLQPPCPSCGEGVPARAHFCPHCGAPRGQE